MVALFHQKSAIQDFFHLAAPFAMIAMSRVMTSLMEVRTSVLAWTISALSSAMRTTWLGACSEARFLAQY